jgi:hypothetical protein
MQTSRRSITALCVHSGSALLARVHTERDQHAAQNDDESRSLAGEVRNGGRYEYERYGEHQRDDPRKQHAGERGQQTSAVTST